MYVWLAICVCADINSLFEMIHVRTSEEAYLRLGHNYYLRFISSVKAKLRLAPLLSA